MALMDAEAYPIAQWGLERFACQGNDVIRFKHHHPEHLRNLLKSRLNTSQRPIVVTDGWCTDCGRLAPLRAYLDCVRQYNGLLIVDDTQALGVLGNHPHPAQPYGIGGGGSLQYLQIDGPDIILISSLAKGFGAPMAVLGGSHRLITEFKGRSETRVHCSPPSWADIHAAAQALHINQRDGDRLRQTLFKRVRHFKQRLLAIGIQTKGGIFPVQKLLLPDSVNVQALHRNLRQAGLRTVLVEKTPGNKEPEIGFVLNANHSIDAINLAVNLVQQVIADQLQRHSSLAGFS